MDRGARTAALVACATAAATAGLVLGARAPEAAAAVSPIERLVADSAVADSAAFASLPSALTTLLDIRTVLTPQALAAPARAQCSTLAEFRHGEERRRLRVVMPDSGTVILYAAADEGSGALSRVEFVRRTPGAGQRGLVWNARLDATSSMWWSEPRRGGERQAERGNIPRGGPVPRVLRALGRQLLTLPCEDSVRTRR
ncbi:MAG: hypothetical protein ACYC0B_05605 [Gemmatimonadaceae bacterium]